MNQPIQYQHRLSQVYLKPFGYQDRKKWYISVLDMTKDHTEQMLVSEYTAEPNVFDYNLLEDIEDRRNFEKLCARIESQYSKVLKSVKKGQITKGEQVTVAWFVATQILEGWDTGSPVKITAAHITKIAGYKEHIDNNKHYPESFAVEHIQWLTMLNVTVDKPLLINAQTWRLFYLSCLALASKGKLK